MAKQKIVVTEELKTLNPELLKDVNVGDKTDVVPELVLKPAGGENSQSNKPLDTGKNKDKKEELTLETLLERINQLESDKAKDSETIKMLEDVADKGRVMNYQSKNTKDKKPIKAQLSLVGDGYLVGWRTLKDELIKHPTSGLVIGESQEFELLILKPDDSLEKVTVSGYPAFSNTRYNSRVEVELVGKEEDYDGNIKFKVKLPDGRITTLAAAFIN